jgi:DNA-directed RNA polymerase specialized sigma24 family protein
MTVDSPQFAAREVANDDLDLVHATKNWDVTAFEQLVKRYDRKLLRIAQSITHNREDSQDAVQEAFLKTLPKPVRIPRGFQILNLALSHHREPVAHEAAQATHHKRGVPR